MLENDFLPVSRRTKVRFQLDRGIVKNLQNKLRVRGVVFDFDSLMIKSINTQKIC